MHVTLLSVEEANLETMRHWAEAIQRGDLPEELWAADLEIVNAEGWALEATHHASNGREA